ncbi:MAG TPA: exosortase-associated EpsI family protein [Candidatus Binatia bacterium]|nr:exosortase-associated EpsI family protein [Candidatus Binatia bacterium]
MNRKVLKICLATMLVMLAGAAFLGTWQQRLRLGAPGIRVVNAPVYGVEDGAGETNGFLVSSNAIYLPEQVLDFKSEPIPVTRTVFNWLPKDTTYGQRMYRAEDGFGIQAMAVLMGKDRTSIHQPQYCLGSQGWERVAEELMEVQMEKPTSYDLSVMRLRVRRSLKDKDGKNHVRSGVFVYWFVADKQLTARHGQRMWWMARDLLRKGVLQRWAYISCFSECAPGQEEAAYTRMCYFIAAAVPEFQLTPATPPKLARIK